MYSIPSQHGTLAGRRHRPAARASESAVSSPSTHACQAIDLAARHTRWWTGSSRPSAAATRLESTSRHLERPCTRRAAGPAA
ncbi:hypothetical protein H9P43_009403 [Blastocladiella emersonii ATCC 22665]|nr:hypothetical protein H9P43_009403 [Blastocladiella emersonii ATCC 22665]